MTTPLFQETIDEMGIVPDEIYARCSSLVAFTAFDPKPATKPRVGQKPTRRKRR
jgi:hypothetical protein